MIASVEESTSYSVVSKAADYESNEKVIETESTVKLENITIKVCCGNLDIDD